MPGARIHIGTSGWHYPHWVGPLYPPGTRPEEFLTHYTCVFQTVEINNSFYRLPTPATLTAWREATPASFVFAAKASRGITHLKKLRDAEASLSRFLNAVTILGEKLGPILFQLPPHWHVDAERLAAFLAILPTGFRYAFEFRDETWFTPRVYRLLARHNAAFCMYDLNRRRAPIKLTADFAYIRLHGPDGPYKGSYDGRALAGWARRIRAWATSGHDVYCYFDNDDQAFAAANAARLMAMLNQQTGP